MKNSSSKRNSIVGFLAILALSAATMLWLFWHHPVSTAIATLAVLAGLGISARLARSIEVDSTTDLDGGEQHI